MSNKPCPGCRAQPGHVHYPDCPIKFAGANHTMGELCSRKDCGAKHQGCLHRYDNRYYCVPCAKKINHHNPADPPLVIIPEELMTQNNNGPSTETKLAAGRDAKSIEEGMNDLSKINTEAANKELGLNPRGWDKVDTSNEDQRPAANIVAVLDIPEDDTADQFIVDITKLDLNDPEQKEYHDAIRQALAVDEDESRSAYSRHLMIYNTEEWPHALITTFPVQIDGTVTIWQGTPQR